MYLKGFRRSVVYISGLHPKNCRAASQELQGCIPKTAMHLRCNGLQPENCRVISLTFFTLHQIDMTGAGIDPSLLRCSEPCINHTLTQIRICGYQYL